MPIFERILGVAVMIIYAIIGIGICIIKILYYLCS